MTCISLQESEKGIGFVSVNYKNCVSILALTVFIIGITACSTSGSTETIRQTASSTQTQRQIGSSTGTNEQAINNSGASRGPLFTGTGGRGLVVAVPAPSMSGSNQTNNWMPQLFQDLITGDLAKYSAMTVLDRRNESLVLAEQQLSASGNYSDDDYIAMGRLTNAKYIVAGNIIGMSGRYSVTFRINDTETNEIQTSFSKQYNTEDIESGLAAKEAVRELLIGMGVELTAEGERQLLTIQESSVRAQTSLARGMAAERNDNSIESLAYFFEALNADQNMQEASQRIQSFGQGSPGASIRERAEWATTQKARWEKIFNDLGAYVNENWLIVVYDLSSLSDQFDARTNTVNITVTPGIKFIPNSTVLTVWKTVIDQWEQMKDLEENKSWADSLRIGSAARDWQDIRAQIGPYYGPARYVATFGLYDADGIRIAEATVGRLMQIWYRDRTSRSPIQVLPQNRYFSTSPFEPITFNRVNIADITDELSVKVDINITYYQMNIPARIMSVTEWEEWLRR
jgi:TolB-like protein